MEKGPVTGKNKTSENPVEEQRPPAQPPHRSANRSSCDQPRRQSFDSTRRTNYEWRRTGRCTHRTTENQTAQRLPLLVLRLRTSPQQKKRENRTLVPKHGRHRKGSNNGKERNRKKKFSHQRVLRSLALRAYDSAVRSWFSFLDRDNQTDDSWYRKRNYHLELSHRSII